MASLKQLKTTSTFKRRYRREVRNVLKEIRANKPQHPARVVNELLQVTLRQRSGHYMKKGVRGIYSLIPAEHKGK